MIELEVAGQRTAVPAGELILGSDPSCGLRLSGIAAAHAVVMATEEGAGVVRRVGDNDVLVNGHKLGAEPAPILHGDKLQLGIHEILIHDPRRSGSTQFVSAADVAKMVAATAKPGALKSATAATGGRLVCLTDGREYTIGSAPLVFGREAGCDIVVPNKDVSRRHAEIFVSPQGYVLVDSSTNGTFVNGERIDGQRILARADVLRVGDHEFRFYADKAPEAPPAAATPLASAPAEIPAPPAPAAGAAERLNETMHGMPLTPPMPPAAPPASAPPAAPKAAPRTSSGAGPLATFLVRSGVLKGQRLQVRVPVVNIGRAEYNDIVVPDDSISGSHAKLQRREGIWILVDNESTNGTWVDGERITGEAMLGPGAVVRFGEISVLFEPTDDHLGTASGSGTKVMGAIRQPAAPAAPPEPAPATPPAPAAAAPAMAPTPPPPAAPVPTSIPAAAPRAPSPSREAGGVSRSGSRPPVIVSSPPPGGMPKWVVPLILVVVLGAVAAYLLTR